MTSWLIHTHMELSVPERVHIMPVGYEQERLIRPAEELRADHVILIGHLHDKGKSGTKGTECLHTAERAITAENIETGVVHCNLFDLHDSLATIAGIISKFKDENVFVNVSSGSKITAIAGMIACMSTDSTPYYVRVSDYKGDTPSGYERVIDLPDYPIDEPEAEYLEVLKYLKEYKNEDEKLTKRHVIDYSEQRGLPFISKEVSGKAKYRLLDSNLLDDMKANDYVRIEPQGRNKIVRITEKGEDLIKAFDFLIDADPSDYKT